MLFLNWFQRFILLLLLHNSGKLVIPHDCLFLILQIMHIFLFKSLQRQGELSIYGDSCVVFWWARIGNRRLSFLRRADIPFVRKGFVAIYFWPIFDRQFQTFILLVMQQYGKGCIVTSVRVKHFDILGCAIDLVDGAQCKYKHKHWFVFYDFLWTCRLTEYCQISSDVNCLPRTCQVH